MTALMDRFKEADPEQHGSYLRRIDDFDRAFDDTAKDSLHEGIAFLLEYCACEKLAKVIMGLAKGHAANWYFEYDRIKRVKVVPANLAKQCRNNNLQVDADDLDLIFSKLPSHGQRIRDQLVHDLGPTRLSHASNAVDVRAAMGRFLRVADQVRGHLKDKSKR